MSNSIQQVRGLNYDNFKAQALDLEPLQTKVSLADVEIEADGRLSILGQAVRTDKDVVEKQLLSQIIKLHPSVGKNIGAIAGGEAKKGIIDILKGVLVQSNVKKSMITIIGDPKSQIITKIIPGDKDYISNAFALEYFERTMNADKDLSLVSYNLNANGSIQLNATKNIILDAVVNGKRLTDEEFKPGFSFYNNPISGSRINSYIERMFCENGATIREVQNEAVLERLDEKFAEKFLTDFMKMRANNFLPTNYPELIERAMNTNASFAEIQQIRNLIISNSDLKNESDKRESTFIPEFPAVVAELARRGKDYTQCKETQLQNYATGYDFWTVYNRLTDFASHDYGFNAKYGKLQNEAGKLLSRTDYDTDNVLVFGKN